jgi:hypothetical protein
VSPDFSPFLSSTACKFLIFASISFSRLYRSIFCSRLVAASNLGAASVSWNRLRSLISESDIIWWISQVCKNSNRYF